MDPNHPSNASIFPGHVTRPNQPVPHARPINQSINVYFQPQFQPQPQYQPRPQFQPHPQFQQRPQFQPRPQFLLQHHTPSSQLALVPAPAQPSMNYPPYDDIIVDAIRDLNEPDGSTKSTISRHIKSSNVVLPPSHSALMTYHLNTLKERGVLTMTNRLYKIAAAAAAAAPPPPPPPPTQSVALAADPVAPRSEVPGMNTSPLALVAASASGSVSASASQPQRRGPGRPRKARPEAPQEQQPINAQPISVLSQGQSSREQPELPVTDPNQVVTESENRHPGGRPRRDRAVPIAPTGGVILGLPAPSTNASMQGRGRPPSLRVAGRQRKRSCIGESSGGVAIAAPAGGETVAVASTMRRGPGRPPKIVRNIPRTSATPMSNRAATGPSESAYGELKRKLDFACEKAKEILDMLNAGNGSNDIIALTQARQEVEGLIPILTVEPHGVGQVQQQGVEEGQPEAMEEVPPEEAAGQNEAETQGEGHGQEVEEGEQAQPQPQHQTEAEAMQEAQI